jgi:hypothetical protein
MPSNDGGRLAQYRNPPDCAGKWHKPEA